MNRVYNITISFVICFNAAGLVCGNLIDTQSCIVYYGMSDASAAVALGNDAFVAADDENNILRIYKTNQTSGPVSTFDLTSFIMADSTYPEADIEGATILGERIYWITSHGRNKDGKMRPTRYRLFATSVKKENETITLTPLGIPCRTLIYDMIASNMTRGLRLDKATKFDVQRITRKELKDLAPKRKGLNIEGLCATPNGNSLYIGLRNPQFSGWATLKKRAIIVPLLNPRQVIENGESAVFGNPILLDLNGLGIRSMEYSHFHKSYLIIAGPKDDKSVFALYQWSGEKEEKPVLLKKFPKSSENFTPEALIVFENSCKLLVLSDDGTINIDISDSSQCLKGKMSGKGKCPNKFLSDQGKKHFRGMWLDPQISPSSQK
jgi:hypothetical protein